jgi:hypothetical protein
MSPEIGNAKPKMRHKIANSEPNWKCRGNNGAKDRKFQAQLETWN